MAHRFAAAGAVVVIALSMAYGTQAQFLAGGALVNAGYQLQDGVHHFEFAHQDAPTAEEVWRDLRSKNQLASTVREVLPRSPAHPLVAMLVCMDARIDTHELAGDTRRNSYVIRTAGSVMSLQEEEMLELAVESGVKVLVITRHTDCAAEKAAADPVTREKYPALTAALDERDQRLKEFLARPAIAARIAKGQLLVKHVLIETTTEHFVDLSAGL
jgi:hypothetical protein